jgi:hypothetical protein
VAVRESAEFRLRGCYPLWPAFPGRSATPHLCNSPVALRRDHTAPTTPTMLSPQATITWLGLGWSPFARHYSGSRVFFPFLRLLRCVTSPAYLSPPYVFRREYARITTRGFPHSEILGSTVDQHLPEAYRSRPRPSSASGAKASTACPSYLDDRAHLCAAMQFSRYPPPVSAPGRSHARGAARGWTRVPAKGRDHAGAHTGRHPCSPCVGKRCGRRRGPPPIVAVRAVAGAHPKGEVPQS